MKLDQHEMSLFSKDDSELTKERRAVRAVALNDQNQVALIEFTAINSRKLPGGGVDDGEELLTALRREVREEIGFEIAEVINEIGLVEENRYYAHLHQVSYNYLVKVGKFVGTKPTKKELRNGIETQWYDSIDDAIAAIQASTGIDEDGDEIGRTMINRRDMYILEAAQALL